MLKIQYYYILYIIIYAYKIYATLLFFGIFNGIPTQNRHD